MKYTLQDRIKTSRTRPETYVLILEIRNHLYRFLHWYILAFYYQFDYMHRQGITESLQNKLDLWVDRYLIVEETILILINVFSHSVSVSDKTNCHWLYLFIPCQLLNKFLPARNFIIPRNCLLSHQWEQVSVNRICKAHNCKL